MGFLHPVVCPKSEAQLITAALLYNGKNAPLWCEELAIAKEANIRPWEVETMPVVWYMRIRTLLAAQDEAVRSQGKR